MNILVLIFLHSLVATAQTVDKEVTITATPVSLKDDVQTYPDKVVITPAPNDVDIDNSLQKLPGALVSQFAGPGTQSAVIAPIATGSGGTLVTVDDVPVLSPYGRGNDLTYFPTSFFKNLEWYSPFYPWSEGRVSPGGRLNLVTRTAVQKNKTETTFGGMAGTGNTLQLSGSAARVNDKNSWLGAVTGFRSDGNYNYVDPRNSTQQTRTSNDGRFVGAVLKSDVELDHGVDVAVTGLGQAGHRTDPGAITMPTAGIGHDLFFGLGTVNVGVNHSYFDDSHQNFILSHAVDRSYYSNFTTYTFGAGPPTAITGMYGGENAQSDYFAYELKGNKKRESVFIQADGLYEKIDAYYPLSTDRQFFGATFSYDALKISGNDFLVPRIRGEQISTLGFNGDGSLSYIHEIELGKEIFASVSFLHKTPSLISLYGYLEGGMPVTGRPSLPVERLEVYSLGYNWVEKTYGLWFTGWYSHHRNMALRTSDPTNGLGFFTQVNDAQTLGAMANVTCQFLEKWSAHGAASLERTRNNDFGTELTFKPAYIVSGSLAYDISEGVSVSAEDIYEGTRYFSASNVASFPNGSAEPMNWTHIKGTFRLGPGSLYLKVTNLFDAAGFDNPGYPYPGRSFWVGYSSESL